MQLVCAFVFAYAKGRFSRHGSNKVNIFSDSKMSSRGQWSPDEGSRSDTPEIDYSVIRTAIKIGGKVIDQVLNGIHYGSAEVRNLLLEECDVILECKVCRNMFRGLPNLVAHKRVYCTDTYKEHKRKENEQASVESEETIVVEPDAPSETVDDNDTPADQNKTSKSVVDKVVNLTFEGQSKSYNFYTKIAEKTEAKKTQKPTSTVTLKTIPSNPNAKAMTVAEKELSEEATANQQSTNTGKVTNDTGEEMRNEIDVEDSAGNVVGTAARTKPTISQLCDKLANISAITVSASKAQSSPSKPAYARPVRLRNRKSSPRKSIDSFIGMKGQETEKSNKTPSPATGHMENIAANNDTVDDDTDFSADMRQFVADYALDKSWLVHCDLKALTCRTCDKSFTTPYGLKFHCKMKHVDKLVQYPCPQCKKKFTYFTALARHLRAVHTKSESDIEFIQSKLKGKLGRRNSLELEETEVDTSDTEKSPEQLNKNMLALDKGWKKCDKCGKICWKAKSYYRHYQYCKGSNDSSKCSSVETSPVKVRDKGQIKKVNEKVKAVLNEKEDALKEKHKFNEKLTIRTRKQAESMNQTVDQNMKSPFEDTNKIAEKIVKSPGITITITEPHEIKDNQKARALNFDEKEQSSKEISPIDIGEVRTDRKNADKGHGTVKLPSDKTISLKENTEKTDKINVNLVGKKIITTEVAAVAQKGSLENRSTAEAHLKDSVTRALQDALLSFNSSLDTEKGKEEITRQHSGNEKQIEQATKQSHHDETGAADKQYVKPVTRKTDQTLKESRRESSDSHQVRSLTISKILMKPVSRQSENDQTLNKQHVKPMTKGVDSTIHSNFKAVKNPNDHEILVKAIDKQSVQSKLTCKVTTSVADRVEASKQIGTGTVVKSDSKAVKRPGTNKTDSRQEDKELEHNQAMNREYNKPVTRRGDGNLPVQSVQNDVAKDSLSAKNFTASKTVTKPAEGRSVFKLLERQKEIQDMQNKDYVKPVTRGAETSLKDTTRKDIHDKDNKVNPEVKRADAMEALAKLKEKQTEFEHNSCNNNLLQSKIDKNYKDKDKQINEDNTKGSAEEKAIAVLGQLKPISIKIPGSPSVKDTDSVRSSLDSPTWTDNPMSKFKMTVKEMAELVESASLTKFARERKKKAKQILNKKQNGSIKKVKKKIKKKKPVPAVKKVYGTRLSTGTKSETVGSSSVESEDRGHRYATRNGDIINPGADIEHNMGHRYETRNMDVKASDGENEQEDKGHRYATRTMNVKTVGKTEQVQMLHEGKHENEGSNKSGARSVKVDSATKNIAKDEIVIKPGIEDPEIGTKVEEHATLNSKRKEFLAAKRDQRRKFLLANKTASPKKLSPEKMQPTRSRVSKDSPVSFSKRSNNAAMKSLFTKSEKRVPKNVKTEKSEHIDVEPAEGHTLRLRSHEPKISETKNAIESVEEQKISKENKKQENVETMESNTIADVSLSRTRQSRYSANREKISHELRSKSTSLERESSRNLVNKSASSERKRSSLPESNSLNPHRTLLIQMKDEISVKSSRSKSIENTPISKLTLSRKAPEKWSLVQSDRELRQPSSKTESIQPIVQVAKISELQNLSPKSNLSSTSINKETVKPVEKEIKKENSDSLSKETKDIDTELRPHKTRLSTGSLPVAIRAEKAINAELYTAQSSSTEDSSREQASKSKKKRKRHLSAPEKKIETEPKEVKHFSLSTGVIQCPRCSKTFWKKTSYTVHLLKSPCGKKQKAVQKKMGNTSAKTMDIQNQSDQEKIDDKDSKQSDASVKISHTLSDQFESSHAGIDHDKVDQSIQENPKNPVHEEVKIDDNASKFERSESEGVKAHEEAKIDDRNNKSERSESEEVKPRTKRPLSVSPKGVAKSPHSDESSVTVKASKRPRLEIIEKSNIESNAPSVTTDSKTEEQIEKEKLIGEEIGENLEIDSVPITQNQDTVNEIITPTEMELTFTKISDEIPGTSKDFTDDDSDTGSEFSGFSEADLSYPTLPEDISDYDSDSSTSKTDFKKDETKRSVENEYEDNESEMAVEKDVEGTEEKNVISIEEVWVGKEPGMPVTEKLKSNRIYVMDTESSRRLHCQDKRNIDSFVDESNMKCLRCEREFSSISNLRQHVIRHLGWKRYQCKTCSVFSCYNLSEARMHLSRSHGIQVDMESDLPKYIKDLNKEAGKKRSTKRMKTIKRKRNIESTAGKKASSSKEKMTVKQDTGDLVASNDTTDTNMTADNENVGEGNSSQNKSDNSANNESESHKLLKEHEYSKDPLNNNGSDNMIEGVEHTVTESNGVLHVEEVHGSVSPVKKSVRLAAKEDTRKSAVEILRGPKLPPSPRKAIVSPKSDSKKTNKPAAKSADSGNTEDESPLVKARQMLAHVLNP